MSFKSTLLLSVTLLATVGLAPESKADSPAKQAQRLFKRAKKDADDNLRECFQIALADFRGELKEVKNAVQGGSMTPMQGVESANQAAGTFAMHMDEHHQYVTNELCGYGTALVNQLGQTPNGFRAGDCGTWDQFVHGAEDLYRAFGDKGMAKLKKLLNAIEKIANAGGQVKIDINIKIGIVLPPPAPAPGPVAPPAPPKPTFKSVSSAHDSNKDNDGKISVRGTGPKNGMVSVNIQGPNGTNITKNVPTDADGCFKVGFPSLPGDFNPGNLPEGNYKVTITSGADSVSQMHGV